MDRSSKYYIVANAWAISAMAISLFEYPYTTAVCGGMSVLNGIFCYFVRDGR